MTTAKQAPAMVAAHQSFLQSEGYRQYAGTFFAERAGIHMDASSTREYFTPEEHQFTGSNWCQYSADILNISQLFHVSESMVEVCKIAAGQLSEDEVWSQEILPARNGVLVFEIPIELVDVWGRIVTVASVQWYVDKDTVAYSYYTDVHSKNDHYNQILALQGNLEPAARITGTWSLCHVDGIKDGKTLGPYFTEDNPELEEYRQEHATDGDPNREYNDRLEPADPGVRPLFGNLDIVLFSIFAMMDQTITDISEETDRRLARRNRNKRRPPPMVTVIQLRRKENHGYHEEGTGRWLNYRSMTRAHWRRQPYKDGSIKRIWINAYIRGPEGAPFHQPKRVSTLAR